MTYEIMYNIVAVYGSTTVRDVISMVSASNADIMLETYTKMHMHQHAECVDYLFFNSDLKGDNELNCEYSGLPSVKSYNSSIDDYNNIY